MWCNCLLIKLFLGYRGLVPFPPSDVMIWCHVYQLQATSPVCKSYILEFCLGLVLAWHQLTPNKSVCARVCVCVCLVVVTESYVAWDDGIIPTSTPSRGRQCWINHWPLMRLSHSCRLSYADVSWSLFALDYAVPQLTNVDEATNSLCRVSPRGLVVT